MDELKLLNQNIQTLQDLVLKLSNINKEINESVQKKTKSL